MRQTSIQKNLVRKELFVFDQIIFLAVNSGRWTATCWRMLQLKELKSRQPGHSRIKEKELVINMDSLFL